MTDWLTTTDIAKQTGLKIDTIYTYRKRNTLPEPDHLIGRTPLWKQKTVSKWIQLRQGVIKMKLKVIKSDSVVNDTFIEFEQDGVTYSAKVSIGEWGVEVDWFKGDSFIDEELLPEALQELGESDLVSILESHAN